MMDLEIALDDRPGALADLGAALARAGVNVEGGGVLAEHPVLVQRLNQGVPGQLGEFSRRLADAGVNIKVMYSDHANQLTLVVDDIELGRSVSEAWMRDWT